MLQEKPWTRLYDEGVPPTLTPYGEQTLLDVLQETVTLRPDHPALLFKGAVIRSGELARQSDAFAAALAGLGVEPGDRVVILAPNCPQAVIAQIGTWKAGAIAAPVNGLYTERELTHALNEVGARIAVVLTPFYEKVKGLQSRTPVEQLIVTNIKSYLPPHLRLLFTVLKEKKGGHRVTVQPGDHRFSRLLKLYQDAPAPQVVIKADDPALLLFTGGTTGLAKAAVTTHRGLMISGRQFTTWFKPILSEWDDVLMLNMPLFHTYGNVAVLATGIANRSPLVLVPDPRDIDDMVATIEKTRPAFLPGVPTLFVALLNHPRVQAGRADLSSIKLCISGAAPLLLELKERFERVTGGRMVEGYALTETSMAGAVTPVLGGYRPGAVGLPLPDVDIRISPTDEPGLALPAGEVGEILIRAPQVMTGYWGRTAESEAAFYDGWLRTGDIGYLDEDGYLYILDRQKDLIKPSGFQVWPREVEEVIATHPAVREVGVAGIPDPYQGEAVKAWVVLREGTTATEAELRTFCRERLAPYKVPRQFEFVAALPKSTVGKILRRELRQEATTPARHVEETSA